MKLSPVLIRAAGGKPTSADRWIPYLEEAARTFAIDTPERMTAWLAQCAHESAGFTRVVENLNYSAVALRSTWPKRFPTEAIAETYAHKPVKIASYVYAMRLGNGTVGSGDGWRFRGRGLIQITGKDNYRECGKGVGADLLAYPELLEAERYGALSAGWFWQSRGLNELADAGDFVEITRRINGGEHGLDDRKRRWTAIKEALTFHVEQ